MRTAAGEMSAAAFFSDLAGDLMDRECVKGFAGKPRGAIKGSAGKVSGDRELELVQADKAKGDMYKAAVNGRTPREMPADTFNK